MKNDATPAHRRWLSALFEPVDISSLVFLRLAMGPLMLFEVGRYLRNGWVRQIWMEPDLHFGYPFFEWVKPWPGNGMIVHFWVLAALAVLIMLGAMYRLSATLFFLGWTYVFLLDQTHYLNHFYLISLVSFLLIFIPSHRRLSIDALLRPSLRSETAPAWAVWLLRFQIGVPYFFGGIAKLNLDWLQGEPMRSWLMLGKAVPLISRFLTEPAAPYFFSWGGLLLDLLVVPLLLIRKTRLWAFAAIVFFHLANDSLFNIGVFPWFMIAATTIFFEPDWPRRMLADIGPKPNWRGVAAGLGAAVGAVAVAISRPEFRTGFPLLPSLVGATAGAVILWTLSARLAPAPASDSKKTQSKRGRASKPDATTPARGLDAASRLTRAQALGAGLLVAWGLGQIAIPLRHFLVPGPVSWTEEGHQFAWHMMLRTKYGSIRYQITDRAAGETWEIDPSTMLSPVQAQRVAIRPQLTHQFARYLDELIASNGRPDVEIRAITQVSLNGRQPQPLVDPNVDLSKQSIRRWHRPWLLPLTQPLPPPGSDRSAEFTSSFRVPLNVLMPPSPP